MLFRLQRYWWVVALSRWHRRGAYRILLTQFKFSIEAELTCLGNSLIWIVRELDRLEAEEEIRKNPKPKIVRNARITLDAGIEAEDTGDFR